MDKKELEAIRKRVMYGRWKKLYNEFRDMGLSHAKCAQALEATYRMLENMNAHGSGRAAEYSYESMQQVCLDEKRGVA